MAKINEQYLSEFDEMVFNKLTKDFRNEVFETRIVYDDESDTYSIIVYSVYKYEDKNSDKTKDYIKRFMNYMKTNFSLKIEEIGSDTDNYVSTVFGPMSDKKLLTIYTLLKLKHTS